MLVKNFHRRNIWGLQRQHELANMKVFASIALFGVMLSQLCNADCTAKESEYLTPLFASCKVPCREKLCNCCTQALTNASSSDYGCCIGYSGLLQCAPSLPGVVPCDTLPEENNEGGESNGDGENNGDSGASTATVFGVISGAMILASSVANQLIL